MSVYFFYGDEDYNIEQAVDNLKSGLDKNFAAMNFKILENPSFPDLIAAVRSQAMMFGRMLTVIKCNAYFEQSGDENSKFSDSQYKELTEALDNNIENSDIAFVVNLARDGKKIDTRKKIFKILSKYNSQEFPAFKMNYYGKQDLANWIKKQAKSKGISLEQDVIDNLIEQVRNNLRELDSELEKLKLIAHPKKNVTLDMVREICITNEDIFDFAELVMSQNYEKALAEYRLLLDKKHPLEILSALQTVLRKRILFKLNVNKSVDEISAITGMSPNQVKAVMRNSKNQTLKQLVHVKENLTNAEYKIKSGQTTDDEGEVQNALLR